MKIKLTKDQIDQILNDSYLDISYEDSDGDNLGVYCEFSPELNLEYIEINGRFGKQKLAKYAFTSEELELLKPKKPYDPSWYHKEPLCPNCQTNLIYHFENCPKCGQRMDWREPQN